MRRAFSHRQALDRGLKRQPNFGATRKIKSRRQNSYDVVVATIELQGLPNYPAASGEILLPKRVANEGYGRGAGPVFFRGEGATQDWFYAQCRQIVHYDAGASNALGFTAPR